MSASSAALRAAIAVARADGSPLGLGANVEERPGGVHLSGHFTLKDLKALVAYLVEKQE